jgi:hypothetical protein
MPNPGGKPPRQDSDQTILRDLRSRITALESSLPMVSDQGASVTSVTINHGRGRVVGVQAFDASGNFVSVTYQCILQTDAVTGAIVSNAVRIVGASAFRYVLIS